VTAIVKDDGPTQTTVADTTGPFGGLGFRKKDRVISTGDRLDRGIVSSLSFCEEGLNDSRRLAFIATLDPPKGEGSRTAVFRATPKR
jgi:hypothetical protein